MSDQEAAAGDERAQFDRAMMRLAIDQARNAWAVGEVPVGAVVVREGTILASAGNRTLELKDPTAHAEMLAIRNFGEKSLDELRQKMREKGFLRDDKITE